MSRPTRSQVERALASVPPSGAVLVCDGDGEPLAHRLPPNPRSAVLVVLDPKPLPAKARWIQRRDGCQSGAFIPGKGWSVSERYAAAHPECLQEPQRDERTDKTDGGAS